MVLDDLQEVRERCLAWEPPGGWSSNLTNPCLAELAISLPPPREQLSLSRDGLGVELEPGQETWQDEPVAEGRASQPLAAVM